MKSINIDEHISWLENLCKENITNEELRKVYSPEVHYRDPFQDVVGIDRVHAVFDKAFGELDDFKIKVTGHAVNESMSTAFISWRMSVTKKKKQMTLEGTTRLLFDDGGLVKESVDFTDASVLFEAIPILGFVLRWIRNHAG